MYRKCDERKLCMYNIYGTNQSACIFTTKWFSQPNGFHDYCISEYTGIFFKRKTFSKIAPLE